VLVLVASCAALGASASAVDLGMEGGMLAASVTYGSLCILVLFCLTGFALVIGVVRSAVRAAEDAEDAATLRKLGPQREVTVASAAPPDDVSTQQTQMLGFGFARSAGQRPGGVARALPRQGVVPVGGAATVSRTSPSRAGLTGRSETLAEDSFSHSNPIGTVETDMPSPTRGESAANRTLIAHPVLAARERPNPESHPATPSASPPRVPGIADTDAVFSVDSPIRAQAYV